MARIAIYSVKGGVGKTTLAVNLAWCSAAEAGHPTVLWDLDPAGGATFLLDVAPAPDTRTRYVFGDGNPAQDIRESAIGGLRILPGSVDANPQSLTKTARMLDRQAERVFIDCPPVRNDLSAAIVKMADLIIVPVPPSPLSSRAFMQVAAQVKALGKTHPPMLPVLSMVDRRRSLHRQAVADAANWPAIPFSSAAEQCAVRRQPVGQFAPQSPTATAIAHLWQAIEAKLADMDRS